MLSPSRASPMLAGDDARGPLGGAATGLAPTPAPGRSQGPPQPLPLSLLGSPPKRMRMSPPAGPEHEPALNWGGAEGGLPPQALPAWTRHASRDTLASLLNAHEQPHTSSARAISPQPHTAARNSYATHVSPVPMQFPGGGFVGSASGAAGSSSGRRWAGASHTQHLSPASHFTLSPLPLHFDAMTGGAATGSTLSRSSSPAPPPMGGWSSAGGSAISSGASGLSPYASEAASHTQTQAPFWPTTGDKPPVPSLLVQAAVQRSGTGAFANSHVPAPSSSYHSKPWQAQEHEPAQHQQLDEFAIGQLEDEDVEEESEGQSQAASSAPARNSQTGKSARGTHGAPASKRSGGRTAPAPAPAPNMTARGTPARQRRQSARAAAAASDSDDDSDESSPSDYVTSRSAPAVAARASAVMAATVRAHPVMAATAVEARPAVVARIAVGSPHVSGAGRAGPRVVMAVQVPCPPGTTPPQQATVLTPAPASVSAWIGANKPATALHHSSPQLHATSAAVVMASPVLLPSGRKGSNAASPPEVTESPMSGTRAIRGRGKGGRGGAAAAVTATPGRASARGATKASSAAAAAAAAAASASPSLGPSAVSLQRLQHAAASPPLRDSPPLRVGHSDSPTLTLSSSGSSSPSAAPALPMRSPLKRPLEAAYARGGVGVGGGGAGGVLNPTVAVATAVAHAPDGSGRPMTAILASVMPVPGTASSHMQHSPQKSQGRLREHSSPALAVMVPQPSQQRGANAGSSPHMASLQPEPSLQQQHQMQHPQLPPRALPLSAHDHPRFPPSSHAHDRLLDSSDAPGGVEVSAGLAPGFHVATPPQLSMRSLGPPSPVSPLPHCTPYGYPDRHDTIAHHHAGMSMGVGEAQGRSTSPVRVGAGMPRSSSSDFLAYRDNATSGSGGGVGGAVGGGVHDDDDAHFSATQFLHADLHDDDEAGSDSEHVTPLLHARQLRRGTGVAASPSSGPAPETPRTQALSQLLSHTALNAWEGSSGASRGGASHPHRIGSPVGGFALHTPPAPDIPSLQLYHTHAHTHTAAGRSAHPPLSGPSSFGGYPQSSMFGSHLSAGGGVFSGSASGSASTRVSPLPLRSASPPPHANTALLHMDAPRRSLMRTALHVPLSAAGSAAASAGPSSLRGTHAHSPLFAPARGPDYGDAMAMLEMELQ